MLSLDLSHNNLNDLLDIIRKLQTLPKLRNLLMKGNPLSVRIHWYSLQELELVTFFVQCQSGTEVQNFGARIYKVLKPSFFVQCQQGTEVQKSLYPAENLGCFGYTDARYFEPWFIFGIRLKGFALFDTKITTSSFIFILFYSRC